MPARRRLSSPRRSPRKPLRGSISREMVMHEMKKVILLHQPPPQAEPCASRAEAVGPTSGSSVEGPPSIPKSNEVVTKVEIEHHVSKAVHTSTTRSKSSQTDLMLSPSWSLKAEVVMRVMPKAKARGLLVPRPLVRSGGQDADALMVAGSSGGVVGGSVACVAPQGFSAPRAAIANAKIGDWPLGGVRCLVPGLRGPNPLCCVEDQSLKRRSSKIAVAACC